MEHSTGYILFMYDAKFVNSGAYTCEVIVDTTFDTLMFTNKMLVIGKFAKKKRLFINHMHCGKKKGFVQLNKCQTGPYFLQNFQCKTMFISVFCISCEPMLFEPEIVRKFCS